MKLSLPLSINQMCTKALGFDGV